MLLNAAFCALQKILINIGGGHALNTNHCKVGSAKYPSPTFAKNSALIESGDTYDHIGAFFERIRRVLDLLSAKEVGEVEIQVLREKGPGPTLVGRKIPSCDHRCPYRASADPAQLRQMADDQRPELLPNALGPGAGKSDHQIGRQQTSSLRNAHLIRRSSPADLRIARPIPAPWIPRPKRASSERSSLPIRSAPPSCWRAWASQSPPPESESTPRSSRNCCFPSKNFRTIGCPNTKCEAVCSARVGGASVDLRDFLSSATGRMSSRSLH